MLGFIIFAIIFIIFLFGVLFLLYPGKPKQSCTVPGLDPADEKNGNFADIRQAGSLHEFLVKLHDDYGHIAGFWWGQKFVISTADPDLFQTQINLFSKPKELYEELLVPFLGESSLLFANDNEARYLRLNLERPFSHESCGEYLQRTIEITGRVVDKWKTFDVEKHIPLRQYMLAMSLQIIMTNLFGDYFSDDEILFKFAKNFDICWSELESRLIEPQSSLDELRMKNFDRAKKELTEQISELIKGRHATKSQHDLFIDDLINVASSEDQRISIILTYVYSGFHTTGNLMFWMLYNLAKHPKCEEKVYKELTKILGTSNLTVSKVAELKYIHQTIEETLRLSCLIPWTSRCAAVDLKIGSFVIPKQTPIIQALGVACQNEKIWNEPMKFDPDRFHADKLAHVNNLSYPYFGFAGKRKCPGYRFVYFEATAVLSVIIRKLNISLVNPDQIAVPVYGLVTRPEDEIFITAKLR